jgi:tRNA nucleotidyltransferase (CCA-adding enzyme)
MHGRLRAAPIPAPVRAVLQRLRDAGHEAWLVGGCVRDLLRGVAIVDYDVTTAASAAELVALFPRAVPIGVRHGTVMVPTSAGPVDVTAFRGATLADDLAHRDFTVNAMAWDPGSATLVDPHDGARDLERGALRAVGDAADRFAEDPLRTLRAARLVATLGLLPDPALEPCMRDARTALRGVARERVRHELEALVRGPAVARGIALLRASGIEADLFPNASADAGKVAQRLPPDLVLRLAAWLRRTHAESLLGRQRFPKRIAAAVGHLVALHPIDARPLRGDADVRRLLRRAGPDGIERLLQLREAEAGVPLAALRERLERVRRADAALGRPDLALDGAAVMKRLGCGPGPEVGAALRHLHECVLEDPTCNTEAALGEELQRWRSRPER